MSRASSERFTVSVIAFIGAVYLCYKFWWVLLIIAGIAGVVIWLSKSGSSENRNPKTDAEAETSWQKSRRLW